VEGLWGFSRRRFLGLVGAAGLPSVGLPASSGEQGGEPSQQAGGASASDSKPELPGLTAHQAETLGALAEQIVPTDTDPGALDAGVVQYIAGVLVGNQASKRPLYEAGLEGVDQTSQLMFGRDFIQLSFQEQTTVLKAIEQGQGPGEIWRTVSSQEFFQMVWNHVLEGFYGPPEKGGNKNYTRVCATSLPMRNCVQPTMRSATTPITRDADIRAGTGTSHQAELRGSVIRIRHPFQQSLALPQELTK